MNNLFSEAKRAVKNWWLHLFIGILTLGVGIFSLLTPKATFGALVILFVITFFTQGVLGVGLALSNTKTRGWSWELALGIIDIVFAAILINDIVLAPLFFCYVLAFWLLFRSLWAITIAIGMRDLRVSNWGWLLLPAILGSLIAIAIFFFPGLAIPLAVYLVGFGFISHGIFEIYLSIKLRSMNNYRGYFQD